MEKNEVMNKKKLEPWAIVLIVFAIVYFLGTIVFTGIIVYTAISESSFNYKETDSSILYDKGNLILEKEFDKFYSVQESCAYITGILKNNGGNDYEYLTIYFNVYDSNGNKLGVATGSIDELDEKETWKFKARYDDVDAELVYSYSFSHLEFY